MPRIVELRKRAEAVPVDPSLDACASGGSEQLTTILGPAAPASRVATVTADPAAPSSKSTMFDGQSGRHTPLASTAAAVMSKLYVPAQRVSGTVAVASGGDV